MNISAPHLERYVGDRLLKYIYENPPEILLVADSSESQRELLAQLKDLERREDELDDAFVAGEIDKERFSRAQAKFTARNKAIQNELARQAERSILMNLPGESYEDLHEAWHRNRGTWKMKVARALMSEIRVDPISDVPVGKRICSEQNCDSPARSRGLCNRHHIQLRTAQTKAGTWRHLEKSEKVPKFNPDRVQIEWR